MPSKRNLIVTDCMHSEWANDARQMEGPATWHLVVLGISAERYINHHKDTLRGLKYESIPLEKYSEAAQKEIQSFYPDFVYRFPRFERLSGVTLLELLRLNPSVNVWWLGDACEKAPGRGPFCKQLYALALLRGVLTDLPCDELWLSLEDKQLEACLRKQARSHFRVRSIPVPIRKGIRRWLTVGQGKFLLLRMMVLRLWFVGTFLFQRLLLNWCKVRTPQQDNAVPAIGFYSRYPILWKNPYTVQQEERYFSHLARYFEKKVKVYYFAMISDTPWELWRHRTHLRDSLAKHNIVPLVLYLTLGDLLKALFDLSLPFAYVWYRRRMAGSVDVTFCGWGISELWDAEVRRSITGLQTQHNLLLLAAVRRMTSNLQLCALASPLEFQPMERALWAGAKGRTKTAAIQHSTFGRNHFMYFFCDGELGEYLRENPIDDASPMPDYCFAAGTWPGEVLLRNGFPPERVGVCGAVRYNDLPDKCRDVRSQLIARESLKFGLGKTLVLVLTSIFRDESIDLIESLAQVAPKLPPQIAFMFKCHYHCRLEDHIERLFQPISSSLPYRILDSQQGLHDFIVAADAVLSGGTTASVEALALGCLPIVYTNPSLLRLTPLEEGVGTAVMVSGSAELQAVLERLASGELDSEGRMRNRNTVLERVFYRLDGRADERIYAFFREKSVL